MADLNDGGESLRAIPTQVEDHHANVGGRERLASTVIGGVMVLDALRRHQEEREGGLVEAGVGLMLLHRGITGRCQMYGALGIDTSWEGGDADALAERTSYHVRKSYTIQKPASELYAVWRRLDTLPGFMEHLERVEVVDDLRSHWRAKGPLGMEAEWDAVIEEDVPGERIAWSSVEGSEVANRGRVEFRELSHDRGTEVVVDIEYAPPAGAIGKRLATLFRENPEHQIEEDLRRFKQYLETGEFTTAERRPENGLVARESLEERKEAIIL